MNDFEVLAKKLLEKYYKVADGTLAISLDQINLIKFVLENIPYILDEVKEIENAKFYN